MHQGEVVDIVYDDASYAMQQGWQRPIGQILPEPEENRQVLVTPINQPGLGQAALVAAQYLKEPLQGLTGRGGDRAVQQVNASRKILDPYPSPLELIDNAAIFGHQTRRWCLPE